MSLGRRYGIFKVAKFALAGASGFLISELILLLGLLALFRSLNVPSTDYFSPTLLELNVLAVGIGIAVSFFINEHITVNVRDDPRRKGVRQLIVRLLKFEAVNGGGSAIGVPTANIEVLYNELLPKAGVYAGYALVDGERLPCVIDIGMSPTFGDVAKPEIHVHILGFKKDIYGKRIDVELINRLRDEKTFSGIDELKRQIEVDIRQTKEVLAYES